MKGVRKAAVRVLGILASAAVIALNSAPQFRAFCELPEDMYVDSAGGGDALFSLEAPFELTDETGVAASGDVGETLGASDEVREYSIALFGVTVKRVRVHGRDGAILMPGGETIGISVMSDGVVVVGLGSIETSAGRVSPAGKAGVRAGDVIVAVDGADITGVDGLKRACTAGTEHVLTVSRGDETLELAITPEKNASGTGAALGMWVRESTAGIGTLSFYVMSTLNYGALGHPVTDPDTGLVIPVREGEVVEAKVVGVSEGTEGEPGELHGTFGSLSKEYGDVADNTEYGVYGTMSAELVNPLYPEGLPLAYPDEVTTGPATILSGVEGEIREYDCEIIRLYSQSFTGSKGLVIRVTDGELIAATGGIVQGMSGSPIIQNGKLAGAVTHVFISDPTKGYGIYALWMYEEAERTR